MWRTGRGGFASDARSGLVDGGAFHWSAGGDASASIFDFGGRRAGVAVTEAQRDAALSSFEGAIQYAFREVADALAVQGPIAERVRAAAAHSEIGRASCRERVWKYVEISVVACPLQKKKPI